MSTSTQEKHGFQAETKQLLQLVINSLYSNKEIFLRELISNASDAIDKLRFMALSDNSLYGQDPNVEIRIHVDKDAKTITISDNGVGMSREEIIENLGTIAKSGTRDFLNALTGDQQKDALLIGQFGVGFYSGFIVADTITVRSRRAGATADQSIEWQSNGDGEYTLDKIKKETRGTDIILHIKSDEESFLDQWQLRSIVRKYSDHIGVPILMTKENFSDPNDKEKQETDNAAPEWETVNRAQALWTMAKKDITDNDYIEFYKHISHDFADPISWSLNTVEGAKLNYISLLYLPGQAPMDTWMREGKRGLKLYVKRVFIMDDAEQFLPNYLRFIKGVVDSSDLPLNISREILQSNSVIESMRAALTKRILGMIEKLSEDKEKYARFWSAFGNALKEGPVEDFANREQIASLLRFTSTNTDSVEQNVTLDEYIARMPSTQDVIYYVIADTFDAAKNSPHLEIFREKKIEVLLLSDRIDEWLMGYLTEYKNKKFQSIAKGDLDIGSLGGEKPEPSAEEKNQFEKILSQMKIALGEKVKDVRLSNRLTASPSCVVVDANDMSGHMQRILQAAGQAAPDVKPILEINAKHPLIVRLCNEQDDAKFNDWSLLLLEQAQLNEGTSLKNPAEFVQRMNKLLLS